MYELNVRHTLTSISRCRQQLGLEVSILEMMQSTLRDLGKKALAMLLLKQQ
jgi:hypothetical protein